MHYVSEFRYADDTIQVCGQVVVWTKLDLAGSYHQYPEKENSVSAIHGQTDVPDGRR